ncbi:hypothetical protein M5689_008388 [Euphorbia peplus]|nr:hypothetical protein M5689_008388 [Euphorbia peplus]
MFLLSLGLPMIDSTTSFSKRAAFRHRFHVPTLIRCIPPPNEWVLLLTSASASAPALTQQKLANVGSPAQQHEAQENPANIAGSAILKKTHLY